MCQDDEASSSFQPSPFHLQPLGQNPNLHPAPSFVYVYVCGAIFCVILCAGWPAVWKTRLTKLFSTTVGTVWCLAAANAVTWKTLRSKEESSAKDLPAESATSPRIQKSPDWQFNFRKYFLDAYELYKFILNFCCVQVTLIISTVINAFLYGHIIQIRAENKYSINKQEKETLAHKSRPKLSRALNSFISLQFADRNSSQGGLVAKNTSPKKTGLSSHVWVGVCSSLCVGVRLLKCVCMRECG